eukprot:835700-Alexandrium_andersonii.AAC.1
MGSAHRKHAPPVVDLRVARRPVRIGAGAHATTRPVLPQNTVDGARPLEHALGDPRQSRPILA